MVRALDRVAEIKGVGVGSLDLDGVVPHRRLVELARYGMGGKTSLLKRHQAARRLATLLATVVYLESKATDDALELLDLLMAGELVGKAERQADKDKLRDYPRLANATAKLADAFEVFLEASGRDEPVSLEAVWEAIEAVVSREELRVSLLRTLSNRTNFPDRRCGRGQRRPPD